MTQVLCAGSLVDERYELQSRAEDCGLGEPWRARDTRLKNRFVTLKFLRPLGVGEAGGRLPSALDDHLQAVRALRHESILAIVNHGIWLDRPYVVHETFEGRSLGNGLDEARATGEALPVALLQALFEKLADALRCGHHAPIPILHLGISPANVLIRRAPGQLFKVKVLDFGIAPWAAVDPLAPIRSARALFNPAPEQLSTTAGSRSVRTDVFAMGALLREMLSLPPNLGETLAIAGFHRQRPEVPNGVWKVIETATRHDPAERYASLDSMFEPLRTAWLEPVSAPVQVAIAPSQLRAAPIPVAEVAPPRLDASMDFAQTPRHAEPAPRFTPFVLPPLPGLAPVADYGATLVEAERSAERSPWDIDVLSEMVVAQAMSPVESVGDFLHRMQRESKPPAPDAVGQTLSIDGFGASPGYTLPASATFARGSIPPGMVAALQHSPTGGDTIALEGTRSPYLPPSYPLPTAPYAAQGAAPTKLSATPWIVAASLAVIVLLGLAFALAR